MTQGRRACAASVAAPVAWQLVPTAPDLAVSLLNARSLVETFGTIGILLIVFAETGLLLGFFLPGDSLLFVAGFAAAGGLTGVRLSLPVLLLTLPVAAIVGAEVGYLIGRRAGPVLFDRPDSRLFRRANVVRAERVLERFGPGKAVLLARFVPIVRTFVTLVAGVSRMSFRHFIGYTAIGGVLWAVGVTTLGYYLGNISFIKNNIDAVLLLIVLVSLIPMAVEFLLHRRRVRRETAPV